MEHIIYLGKGVIADNIVANQIGDSLVVSYNRIDTYLLGSLKDGDLIVDCDNPEVMILFKKNISYNTIEYHAYIDKFNKYKERVNDYIQYMLLDDSNKFRMATENEKAYFFQLMELNECVFDMELKTINKKNYKDHEKEKI